MVNTTVGLHCIRACLVVAATSSLAAPQTPATSASASYRILLRGTQIGTEDVSVAREASGWTITSMGRTGPPLDLVIRNVQLRYDPDWKPLELTIDSTVRNQAFGVHITVSGTTATTHINNAGQGSDRADTIAADTIFLPNPFFASYEALAARLRTAPVGSTIQAYQGAPLQVTINVGESEAERIQTVDRVIEARHSHITLTAAGVPEVAADIWSDEAGHLLRVSVPIQAMEYVRADIASVASRVVTISRTGDEQVRIPANGFNLAGTISKPARSTSAMRHPAIILVAGSGPQDRDETVAGIPVFGQLAGALADAGYMVLRYDKRGVGQSGGRIESAGLADYAEDLRAAVKFMSDRKDVDTKRITSAGHSEGGAITLMEAARNNRIAAVVLMAAPGMKGTDLILAQQKHVLDRSSMSDGDKQARIELQKKIHEAVISGKGWEALPADVRRQVDNPEFQSILLFDPAPVVAKVRQPILIVQGLLDTQVDPSNADQLEAAAKARKRPAPVETVKIPGVNHLFAPAVSGEVAEYTTLKDKQISPALASAIAAWLTKTLPAGIR